MASSANENANLSCLSTNSGIVRQLISRIEELSQAVSPSDSLRNSNNIINGEVWRIFTATGTARVGVGATNENNEASNIVTATRPATSIHQVPRTGQPYVIPSSSREERLPIRRDAFSARRYFPSQRVRQLAPSSRRRANRMNVDERPFLRDLILLSGPGDTVVPCQGARLLLTEHGHVITACRFIKSLTPAQVEVNIIEAFGSKIPAGVDIELLMSVHTSLVAPTLAHGQLGIDSVILHRLFRQKPVYIRPSHQLLNTRMESQVKLAVMIMPFMIIAIYIQISLAQVKHLLISCSAILQCPMPNHLLFIGSLQEYLGLL